MFSITQSFNDSLGVFPPTSTVSIVYNCGPFHGILVYAWASHLKHSLPYNIRHSNINNERVFFQIKWPVSWAMIESIIHTMNCRNIIFVWRRHENMSPCTGSRVMTSYERITSCAATQFRSRASEFQGNSATRHYAEGPNQTTMTRSSKMDWQLPYCITYPAKQRADSEQDANSDVIIVGIPSLIQFHTLPKICKTCLMFIWNFYRCYMNLNYDCIETDGDY